MQELFLPIFGLVLVSLFFAMLYTASRKQAQVNSVRSKHYHRQRMQEASRQNSSSNNSYEVVRERRSGIDRRAVADASRPLDPDALNRRKNTGRRKEDQPWSNILWSK